MTIAAYRHNQLGHLSLMEMFQPISNNKPYKNLARFPDAFRADTYRAAEPAFGLSPLQSQVIFENPWLFILYIHLKLSLLYGRLQNRFRLISS